jgi:hypothetical protein
MRIETILLLNRRPDHSVAVLDSLVANGVDHVLAFMDYSDEPTIGADQTRLVDAISSRSDIEVTLHRHSRPLGLAGSVRYGLQTAMEKADAVIVLEDDCVVRPGGMAFFRQALEELRDDPRIRSVCGYLFPCPFIRERDRPLLLSRFCPWGWATWRDRWQQHEPNLKKVVDAFAARALRIEDYADDLAALCRSPRYLENRVDVWSVAWALEHFLTGTFAVYPPDSMIDNIGFDGSGANCLPSTDFATEGRAAAPTWRWTELVHRAENDQMLKRFMSEHGVKIYPTA